MSQERNYHQGKPMPLPNEEEMPGLAARIEELAQDPRREFRFHEGPYAPKVVIVDQLHGTQCSLWFSRSWSPAHAGRAIKLITDALIGTREEPLRLPYACAHFQAVLEFTNLALATPVGEA